MARQFYISNENIINDNQIKISGAEHTHISRVLRLSVGDEIIVSNFIDKEFNCKITEIKKDYTLLKILSTSDLKPTDYNITLFQAIIKGEHMEWCVQKTTELGVTKIIPFISTFTNVKPKDNKQERLSKIAVEACKQSGRNVMPQISNIVQYNEMLEKLKEYSQIIVAYEKETKPAKEIITKLDKTKPVAIIVGSEGGFSEQEIEDFKNLGASVVSMGKNILRAETASVALLSALLYELGEWKNE